MNLLTKLLIALGITIVLGVLTRRHWTSPQTTFVGFVCFALGSYGLVDVYDRHCWHLFHLWSPSLILYLQGYGFIRARDNDKRSEDVIKPKD